MEIIYLLSSYIIIIIVLLIGSGQSSLNFHHSRSTRHSKKTTSSNNNNDIIDFRYNTGRIDGIINFINGSLLIISNGYYWLLDYNNPLPSTYNVNGRVEQLYDGFDKIDAMWIDPYNDISPQIYLISNSPEYGLRVVCKEFDDEPFNDVSSFCHLPVDNRWLTALKDLDPNRPIDAATWRNRTKNQDGGFWVFFQGRKMITIDPYEMKLRFTYDIQKWMSINDSLTAAFFDYRKSIYHLFLDNNRYYTWTVNISYMNSLPMSWDRAFLHGKLSPLMQINRDFFGFPEKDIRPYPQPYLRKNSQDIQTNHIVPGEEFDDDMDVRRRRLSTTTTTTTLAPRHWLPRKPIQPKLPYNYNQRNNENKHDNNDDRSNFIQTDYDSHLWRLKQENVRDFIPIKSNHIRQTDISSEALLVHSSTSLSSTSSTNISKPCTKMIYFITVF
uniref:Uncharacterized protein LOC113798200 n=1 Tax=Dermatophagoides pteronyssinus TaxID=6956 RepID=A0A6P6YGY3_DERPT